ncbi:MAG TPA: hypothetical protein VJY34_12670, partial [Roseiarcus sp.]|nr:hypothetical protein [Roseiarcus sp.]
DYDARLASTDQACSSDEGPGSVIAARPFPAAFLVMLAHSMYAHAPWAPAAGNDLVLAAAPSLARQDAFDNRSVAASLFNFIRGKMTREQHGCSAPAQCGCEAQNENARNTDLARAASA